MPGAFLAEVRPKSKCLAIIVAGRPKSDRVESVGDFDAIRHRLGLGWHDGGRSALARAGKRSRSLTKQQLLGRWLTGSRFRSRVSAFSPGNPLYRRSRARRRATQDHGGASGPADDLVVSSSSIPDGYDRGGRGRANVSASPKGLRSGSGATEATAFFRPKRAASTAIEPHNRCGMGGTSSGLGAPLPKTVFGRTSGWPFSSPHDPALRG